MRICWFRAGSAGKASSVIGRLILALMAGWTGLTGLLLTNGSQSRRVARIYVGGLATDYCVKATVLDGLKHGYEVIVLKDGIRAVDVDRGDGQRAISQMADEGAIII
jgi:nicotinamidase/pyrazinamidase